MIVVTLDRCFLDRATHAFYLAIGPVVADLGEPVLNMVRLADSIEGNIPIVFCALTFCKLDAIVGQNRVNGVGHCSDQIAEKKSGVSEFLCVRRRETFPRCRRRPVFRPGASGALGKSVIF